MQCVDIRNKLHGWADGELQPDEAESVAHHIAHCPDCCFEAEIVQKLVASLDALPGLRAPARLQRKALGLLRAHVEKPGLSEWWRNLSLAMRGAVCATVLAGLLCGAMLGGSMVFNGTAGSADPYRTLYASKGILP